MPEGMIEQSNRIAAVLILVAGECAADVRLQSDEGKEIGADLGDGNLLGAVRVAQGPGGSEGGGEEVEALLAVAPLGVQGVKGLERPGVVLREDGHDAARLGKREWPESPDCGARDADRSGDPGRSIW